jgi:hypothetical protein
MRAATEAEIAKAAAPPKVTKAEDEVKGWEDEFYAILGFFGTIFVCAMAFGAFYGFIKLVKWAWES